MMNPQLFYDFGKSNSTKIPDNVLNSVLSYYYTQLYASVFYPFYDYFAINLKEREHFVNIGLNSNGFWEQQGYGAEEMKTCTGVDLYLQVPTGYSLQVYNSQKQLVGTMTPDNNVIKYYSKSYWNEKDIILEDEEISASERQANFTIYVTLIDQNTGIQSPESKITFYINIDN